MLSRKGAQGICDIAEMYGGIEEELDKERFTKNNLRYVRSRPDGPICQTTARRPKQDRKGSYNFQDGIERAAPWNFTLGKDTVD